MGKLVGSWSQKPEVRISHGTPFLGRKHALNKIIRTESLLCVIDRATPSSGRGIALGGSALLCAQTWRPNSNFEQEPAHTQHYLTHTIVYYQPCHGLIIDPRIVFMYIIMMGVI